ncbi:MAG: DUF3144 domain-containing protein [Chromatiaceae bacterium]|nr:DUF3144 domain-containing protein [Chromatiaceae bacterium]MCP5437590.1 DUF3144 domain-containing protein [Chromatiaceae bacterium]MCP5439706.1 DUF3144 domain-containing protein [Chromatiaceae bacterium]
MCQASTLTEYTGLATVAAGLHYTAARFAAFEASLQTADLHRDKVEALDAYLNDFRAMLDVSLERYIEQQSGIRPLTNPLQPFPDLIPNDRSGRPSDSRIPINDLLR